MPSQLPLQVFQLSTIAELESLRQRWNELAAGVPMRSWEWLEGWWRVYGNANRDRLSDRDGHQGAVAGNELYILAVFEAPDQLVGIAPWYIEHCATQGRILRFLGSGEVCTDYSTILCEPGYERAVPQALARTLCDPLHLADWLTQNSVRHWDRIDFDSVPTDDKVMQELLAELGRQDNLVHRRQAENCWRLQLPKSWDDYLASLSKGHRKQVRRCLRELFETGRAQLHEVTSQDDFEPAWERLVRLHQWRYQGLGKPGCFASDRYYDFHEDVARRLLDAGMLRLQWLEVDGRELAAEYHLIGAGSVYAYQGGLDPSALELGPGRLSMLAAIRQAIAEGRTTFDFMRGDEKYKSHWRAEPIATEDIRVVKRTASNRVRHGLWVAGDHVKQWIKSGFGSMSTS